MSESLDAPMTSDTGSPATSTGKLLRLRLLLLVSVLAVWTAFAATASAADHPLRGAASGSTGGRAKISIQFGTGFKHGKLTGRTTKINRGKTLAWVARFTSRPGATTVDLMIVKLTGPGQHPKFFPQGTAKCFIP